MEYLGTSGGQLYHRVTNEVHNSDSEFNIQRMTIALIRGECRLEIKARVPEYNRSWESMGVLRVVRGRH